MTLEIDNPEIDRLVRDLVSFTGESSSQVVLNALRERMDRVRAKQHRQTSVKQELRRISMECASLPVLDSRTPEEILGYDSIGVPT